MAVLNFKGNGEKLRCYISVNLFFLFLCAVSTWIIRILPKNIYAAVIFKITVFTFFQLFEFVLCSAFYNETKNLYGLLKTFFKKFFFKILIFSQIKLIVFTCLLFLLRIFLQKESITGNIFALIILTLFFFLFFSCFWFFAEAQIKDKTFFCNLKNSFYLFFNNPFFTFRVFFVNMLYAIISGFLFFIFPGIAGMCFNYCKSYKKIKGE